ncbi:hypothetical protein PFISCL1PPCAC_24052, partial [Pristionchus fissidentatus]
MVIGIEYYVMRRNEGGSGSILDGFEVIGQSSGSSRTLLRLNSSLIDGNNETLQRLVDKESSASLLSNDSVVIGLQYEVLFPLEFQSSSEHSIFIGESSCNARSLVSSDLEVVALSPDGSIESDDGRLGDISRSNQIVVHKVDPR